MQRSTLRVAGLAVVAITAALAPPAVAVPPVNFAPDFRPPEIERLERHAYDYYDRNSNGNVYRRSRHFHPTRNVFRSSRYYQQKLAASYSAYPLRTWVRYAETRNGQSRERSYNWAHPPADRYPRYRDAELIVTGPIVDADVAPSPAGGPALGRQRARRMARPTPPTRPATQRPVMRTVTLPDGRTKTIIESVPIETSAIAAAEPAAALDETGAGHTTVEVAEDAAADAVDERRSDDDGLAETDPA